MIVEQFAISIFIYLRGYRLGGALLRVGDLDFLGIGEEQNCYAVDAYGLALGADYHQVASDLHL